MLKGITGSDAAGLLRLGGGGDIRKGRGAGKEWKRLLG